jgi:hypothetical protein
MSKLNMKNALAVIMVLFTACSATAGIPIPEDGYHPVVKDIKYASCDYEFYQKGHDGSGKVYSKPYEDVANKAFVYALMASNAYKRYSQFDIPGWDRLPEEDRHTWTGMEAIVYKSSNSDKIVVAFAGTNSALDYLAANFIPFLKGQYRNADTLIDDIFEKYKNHSIIATGHSLGGGLALHASLYRANIDAYAFNTSPRVFQPDNDLDLDETNHRLVVSEKGEILEIVREIWPALDRIAFDGPYDEFDFLRDTRVKEHSMYYIARGLTIVAASTGNTLAKAVMQENMGCTF